MPQTLEIERLASPGGQLEMRLKGALVLGTMFDLQQMLRENATTTTILDLSGISFMDSAGLGVLINSYVSHQKNGRKLVLAGVPDRVVQLLKITRVDNLFEMKPDLEAARAAARA